MARTDNSQSRTKNTRRPRKATGKQKEETGSGGVAKAVGEPDGLALAAGDLQPTETGPRGTRRGRPRAPASGPNRATTTEAGPADPVREELRHTQEALRETRQQVEELTRAIRDAHAQAGRPEATERPAQEPSWAGPSEASGESLPVVPLTGRARGRLLRYLNDAWAAEKTLLDTLQTLAEEVADPALHDILQEHRRTTDTQKQALETRLRALGEEPSGGPGFFSQLLTRLGDALHRPADDHDRRLQALMKGFAAEQFVAALYHALAAYAEAVGEGETARLAAEHLRQEQEMAERLRPFLAPTAVRAARAMGEGP